MSKVISILYFIGRTFAGLFVLLFGCIPLISLYTGREVEGLGFFLILIPLGLGIMFPRSIGLRIKSALKYLCSPIKRLEMKLEGLISRYKPENSIDRLFENRIFQAIFFIGLAFFAWESSFNEKGNKEVLLTLGAIFFGILGAYALFPTLVKIIGLIVVWLVGLGIMGWIAYAIAHAIGAVPFAIIVGAMIIASAIQSKR